MIRTLETDPQPPYGYAGVAPAEWHRVFVLDELHSRGIQHAHAWLTRKGVDAYPDFPRAVSLERTVSARVNDGRWLWDCPHCDGVSYVASFNDPRAFCAAGCFNSREGWWPILFPDEQATIEMLLSRRPHDRQRNWTAAETVEQLQLENISLGIDPIVPGYPWPGATEAVAIAAAYHAERELATAGQRRELRP